MSLSPDSLHQYVGDLLSQRLREAAPDGVFVLTVSTVRIGDDWTGLIPDIVVTTVDARERRRWLEPHEVVVVVEIVSPLTGRRDRVLKPDVYASVGIACFWRVELSPFRSPTVRWRFRRSSCAPARRTRLSAGPDAAPGEIAEAPLPFPVQLDPADLA